MATVWYHVRDLDAARDFYTRRLGFTDVFDPDGNRVQFAQQL